VTGKTRRNIKLVKKLYPCHSGQSTLADAKARLNIHDLWPHFGFPGEPKASCRCPWRDDHKPSFSIFADGMRWRDFATDEGGDVIDFLAKARGLSLGDAIREFKRLL